MPKLPSILLPLSFPVALGFGAAIALVEVTLSPQPQYQRSPSAVLPQSDPLAQAVDRCGKYCENYPGSMTKVRLRDWQP